MQQTEEMSMLLKIGNATVEGKVFLTEEGKSCKDYEATYTYSEIDCHRVY